MAIYDLGFGHRDPKTVACDYPRPDGRFDVRHAYTRVKFPPNLPKNGHFRPFMAIYDLGFGHRDPKMVPCERPRQDGRFDVRHAHTRVKFPRKVPNMAIYGHFGPL